MGRGRAAKRVESARLSAIDMYLISCRKAGRWPGIVTDLNGVDCFPRRTRLSFYDCSKLGAASQALSPRIRDRAVQRSRKGCRALGRLYTTRSFLLVCVAPPRGDCARSAFPSLAPPLSLCLSLLASSARGKLQHD